MRDQRPCMGQWDQGPWGTSDQQGPGTMDAFCRALRRRRPSQMGPAHMERFGAQTSERKIPALTHHSTPTEKKDTTQPSKQTATPAQQQHIK